MSLSSCIAVNEFISAALQGYEGLGITPEAFPSYQGQEILLLFLLVLSTGKVILKVMGRSQDASGC